MEYIAGFRTSVVTHFEGAITRTDEPVQLWKQNSQHQINSVEYSKKKGEPRHGRPTPMALEPPAKQEDDKYEKKSK